MDNDQSNNNGGVADLTPDQDDLEWGQALDSYSKDRGVEPGAPVKKEGTPDAGTKPNDNQPAPTGDKPAAGTGKSGDQGAQPPADGAKPDGAKPEGTDANKPAAETPDNPAIRETRQTQREIMRQEQEMKEDIRKELFGDKQTKLLDSDGDEIKGIEDVQKLKNPATGKAFTEEEAAAWLLKAQRHLNEQVAADDAEIERIADVNLSLMDQADAVKSRFGDLLKSMPDVAKKIVTKFNQSLKTDPKTGYILDAPVNMEDFFELALEPYQKQAEQIEAQKEEDTKKAEAEKEAKRKQTRQDRSDIYGGGKVETMDEDEKEWADAAKSYYQNK